MSIPQPQREPGATLRRIAPGESASGIEAERSVLGSVLIDNAALPALASILDPDDFGDPVHQLIWRTFRALDADREPIDYITTMDRVARLIAAAKADGLDAPEFGMDYLAELAERVPTAANATAYARIVRGAATIRRGRALARRIDAGAPEQAPEAWVETVVGEVEEFRTRALNRGEAAAVGATLAIGEALQHFDDVAAGRKAGRTQTGLAALDELLGGGLESPVYCLLAARPSMGKTAFALTILRYAATSLGLRPLLISVEQTRRQLGQNALIAQARVPLWKLNRGAGSLSEDEFERIRTAATALSELQIAAGRQTLEQVRARMIHGVKRDGCRLIAIDYLQLIDLQGSTREPRQEAVSRASRLLHDTAYELGVPLILLAQINREAAKQQRRPRMEDLRESGTLEQDADVILLLHREHYYTHNEEDAGKAEVIVAKQRDGRRGTAHVEFDGELLRFRNAVEPEPVLLPGHRSAAAVLAEEPPRIRHSADLDRARWGEREADHDEAPTL